MAASLSYRPEQYEQPYYLAMYKAADVQGNGNISGAEAVKFFGRSKLPVDVLKNIWTVSDQPSTSSLDLKKFAVAVRLIQLTQNGQKGTGQNLEAPRGVFLKPVFFEGVSGVTIPLPTPPPTQQKQGRLPPTHPTPQQPNRNMPPPQQSYRAPTPPAGPTPPGSRLPSPASPRRSLPPQLLPSPATPRRSLPPQQLAPTMPSQALVSMDPYTLSPQECQRYEGLFPMYAKTEADGSKFVYGSEAVPLFMKSGVDPNHLREIWNMVDRNPVDNRLDKLEFALAMHLIVCVSKKNLPMPQGGTLPSSLQALKVASGGNDGSVQSAPSQAAPPQQMPPPQAELTAMPPAPSLAARAPLGVGGMDISDAFEGMSAIGSVTDYSQLTSTLQEPLASPALPSYVPAAPQAPPTPQPQPTYVPQPEAPAAPAPVPVAPTPVATYEVSDSNSEELTKLKSALQKLQAENISLKAQLGSMTEEEKHVQQELGQTVTEITALSTDLGNQRQQVLDAKNRLLEAKGELNAKKGTKVVLTELISEAKETTQAIDSATDTLRATSLAQNSAPPVPESQDLFGMGYSNPVPAAPVPQQEGPGGFANEHNEMGMAGGVTSLATPPQQPAVNIMAPGSTPEEQNQFSIPEPTGGDQQQQMMYSRPEEGGYAPGPVPPPQQAGGYPPPQQDYPPPQQAGGYPAQAQMPPPQQTGGYPAQAPMPQQAGGYPAQAQMPPPQQAGGYPAQAQMPPPQQAGGYPGQAQMPPPQQAGGYPAQAPMPTPVAERHASDFEDGFLMGGSAPETPLDSSRDGDNFSVAARSMASSGDYGYDDQAFEIVENMKKKAKKADAAARDAEATYRKQAEEADELRTDADRAEANARSLAAAPDEKQKKKGRFSGGSKKKEKKKKGEADQAAKDAAQIKSHFMKIQGQALEAQTVASQMRTEADRLRDEAEAAELDMAAAASKKQKQPSPARAAPPAAQPAAGGYGNVPQTPNYGGMGGAPQQQPQSQAPQYGMPNGGPAMMPPNGGGYNNYMNGMGGNTYDQQQMQPPQQQAYGAQPQMSLPDPSNTAPGVMGGGDYGGYAMPSPGDFGQMAPAPAAPAAGGDPYASPF